MTLRVSTAAFALAAAGAAQYARADSAASGAGTITGQIMSLVMGMAVVLAIIMGAAWLLKRLAPQNYGGAGVLRVVAGTAVGQRERVVVVEVGTTWLVLGVTANSVNALHQLPRLATAAAAVETAPQPGAFAVWFKHMLEKRGER